MASSDSIALSMHSYFGKAPSSGINWMPFYVELQALRGNTMKIRCEGSRAASITGKEMSVYKKAVQIELAKIGDRGELARKRMNALGTGPSYLDAHNQLSACNEKSPCGLSACVECAYWFRLSYIISALRLFGHCDSMHQVTILDKIIELDDLGAEIAKPKNLFRRLKRKMKKCGLGDVLAFGDLEVAFEKVADESLSKTNVLKKGIYILHYHIIFFEVNKTKLETLRIAFPETKLKRRVLITPVKNTLEDRVKVFSYCCKRTDYYREKTSEKGLTVYRKPQPIPLQYRRVLLNYLAKYKMSDFQLHHNIPFRRGIITDS